MSDAPVIEGARAVRIGRSSLAGEWWHLPEGSGVTVFVHGPGGRHDSARHRFLARMLHGHGQSTLSFDLLTTEESADRRQAFNVPLLSERLELALDWLAEEMGAGALPVGLFSAGTGAAAALRVAARQPQRVRAVVSRSGRPDLAGIAPARVHAPTLLIVGGQDTELLRVNHEMLQALRCVRRLDVVPRASHRFEEPGALQEVARLAGRWLAGSTHGALSEAYAA